MRCSSCKAENPEATKFCIECGVPFKRRCSECRFLNLPQARFCGECGIALGDAKSSVPASAPDSTIDSLPAIEPLPTAAASLPDGERKTVTALFADIKGSMDLMEDLDPEEARAIIDPALKLMIDAARRYDGYIVQSTGDGIFALFGAPVAREDHPQRALYAALRMQEDLKRYSDRLRVLGKVPLQARVGVNTGEVVVRSIATGEGQTEYTPIGHSSGLAARMQVLAPIGSIAVTQATQRLCEGYFAFRALGPTTVKGVSGPINVFELTGLGPLRTRLQVSAQRGFTKFVGRQAELDQMKQALELVRQNHGQIVAAIGDPGVGKSRLLYEFKAVAQTGCLVLEAYSVSHGKASAYLPVIELLNGYFAIDDEDDERKRREKINGKIITLDPALQDTLPYLFALLGIVGADAPLDQLNPQLRRRRTLESVKRVLLRESLSQPLIVIFEDLHWIDSETQAFLNLIVDGLANARILLLVNYRPEYQHQWGGKTYYTQLRLVPLGKESADEMLTALLGGDNEEILPLKRLIVERSEGNPFFIEEMCRALFEQGVLARNGTVRLAKPLNDIRVPLTVQAILTSRIDRLALAEKELLQILAVIGREFPLALIGRMTGKSDHELEPILSTLRQAEFIYEQPGFPDIEYIFKHALTQEVAYSAVLSERRQLLHELAAQAIEELYADRLEDHLTDLARHFDRGGNASKAVEYLARAGSRAAGQAAHSEAIGYFNRALELLPKLPDGVGRDRQELDLQMAVSWSSWVFLGLQGLQRGSALLRARELCERLGDQTMLMEALLALAHLRYNQCDFDTTQELAHSVFVMAQQENNAAMLGGSHFVTGILKFALGDFRATSDYLERAVQFLSARASRNWGALYEHIAPACLCYSLANLGHPLAAHDRAQNFLAAARRTSDPFSIAFALLGNCMINLLLRDHDVVGERAHEMFSIADEYEMRLPLVLATFFQGWAMAASERVEDGITAMRQSVLDPMLSRAAIAAMLRTSLAEACGQHERADEGLDLVAQGMTNAQQTGMRVAEAELLRLRGEMLGVDPGKAEEAERSLRTAIDVAHRQGARLFELRSATSLARMLRHTDRREETRTILAGIYGWFTEGFDTIDLKEAKKLLGELTS
jgi:class 3 adenylate cyclase/tetratricopeptide (TPR) repeat protein